MLFFKVLHEAFFHKDVVNTQNKLIIFCDDPPAMCKEFFIMTSNMYKLNFKVNFSFSQLKSSNIHILKVLSHCNFLCGLIMILANGKHKYQNLPTRTQSFVLNSHITEND